MANGPLEEHEVETLSADGVITKSEIDARDPNQLLGASKDEDD